MPGLSVAVFQTSDHGPRNPWRCLVCSEGADIDQLAADLAEAIVKLRCRWCPASHLQHWLDVRSGGAPLAPETTALREFINIGFGLPQKQVPDDHLEAAVAEHLWYFIAVDEATGTDTCFVTPPSLEPTEHGADSIVLHSPSSGRRYFRLWELKKNTGSSRVSDTVSQAYDQIEANARSYIARQMMDPPAEIKTDPAAVQWWQEMMDFWDRRSREAGVGVSVATSVSKLPRRCFSTFQKRFPALSLSHQLLGALMAVGDFPAFARLVRDELWKGI